VFAQVIQGRTRNEDAFIDRFMEWDRSIKPGARGFLGSTGGVSDDGEFIVIARFESEAAARANSDRPEQGQWWAETEKLFEGEPRFYDCTEVELTWGGGSDVAGFVQVIQGRLKEEAQKARWREMEANAESWLRENRPEIIGGVRAWQGNNFSDFIYFTSEEEARIGEKKETPPEAGGMEDWSAQVDDMKFIDLRRPYFSSP
jgi:heme-degrading monooxygenase HmoA